MTTPQWDKLWLNVNLATMTSGAETSFISDGALALSGDRISWVGPRAQLPRGFDGGKLETIDGERGWLLPGFIDCHTHLIYAGNRAEEFEWRLNGLNYEEISRRGGGIWSTVEATRQADIDALVAQSLPRLTSLLSEGVTTIEIKSGYGLDTANELKILRAARRLAEIAPARIVPTFLGAHALPPEFANRRRAFVDLVCDDMLPAVHREGLATAVDAYCETIGFSTDEVGAVFARARELHLPVKLHAEQLSDCGGANLAASFSALSADHLEYASTSGVAAMARAGTIAVLLPGAFYTLRETRLPPIALFRKLGVAMAVATDCNPGTSPFASMLLMLNMACNLFRLTPNEALIGATLNAAKALGLELELGSLAAGKLATFNVWDIDHPRELCFDFHRQRPRQVFIAGRRVDVQ